MRPTVLLTGIGVLVALLMSVGASSTDLQRPQFVPGMPMIAGDNVLISWIPTPDTESYHIYLNGKKIGAALGPPHMAPLPEGFGTFIYQISAVNSYGEEGELSEPGTIYLKKIEAPQNLYAEIGPDLRAIHISWDPVPDAFNYHVLRGEEGGPMEMLAVIPNPQYRDTKVRPGIWYFYTVVAVDVSGLKGPRSEELNLEIDPSKASAVALSAAALPMKKETLAAEEVFTLTNINGTDLVNVSFLGTGPGGSIWVVIPSAREIHQLESSGRVRSTLGPSIFESRENNFTPHKMDVGSDGKIYVSDVQHGALACLNPRGDIVWKIYLKSPPQMDMSAWNGFPNYYPNLPPTPSSVLCLPGEIWVTDQRFQLIYRVSYDGKLVGYLTHYIKGGRKWRFRRLGELGQTADGRFLITFPLVKKILGINEKSENIFEIDGSGVSQNYRFLAIHGINVTKDNLLLVTDPASGNLVAFSSIDGEYLYHLGGDSVDRPLGLSKPTMAAVDQKGLIWVYVAGENRIAALKPHKVEN